MKELSLTCQIQIYSFEELSEADRLLVEKAKKAAYNSYAPYSKFNVGAALLLEDDSIITGNNQENAAYPSGTCAERTALFYAGAQYPDKSIKALAIAARTDDGFTPTPVPPCGACRQVIIEMEKRHTGYPIRIILYGVENTYVVKGGASTLLPIQFDDSYL